MRAEIEKNCEKDFGRRRAPGALALAHRHGRVYNASSQSGRGDDMTVQELYESIGGNYEAAKRILMNDALIARFVAKLPEDKSFEKLSAAAETMDAQGLFEGAHAMKGVCANLGMENLSRAASELAEEFRPGNERTMDDGTVREKVEALRALHGRAVDGIRRFAAEKG